MRKSFPLYSCRMIAKVELLGVFTCLAGDIMGRASIWQLSITLILLSIGFLTVGVIGYLMSPDWLTAEEIQEQARAAIPQPVIPPPPLGRQELQTINRRVCTDVPSVSGLQIKMSPICSDVPEVVPRSVDPTNEELREWEEKVDVLKRAYDLAITTEAARISDRQRADLKTFVKDIVQIATGMLGLLTGLIALVLSAWKDKQDPSHQKPRHRFRSG